MSDDSNNDRVGYGRPPKYSRWKKGQSGNPRKRKAEPPESMVALIDRLLLSKVQITLAGEMQGVPALEAIVLQLLKKANSGNGAAFRTSLTYQEFANRNLGKQLVLNFVDSDYTTAFAAQAQGDRDAGV